MLRSYKGERIFCGCERVISVSTSYRVLSRDTAQVRNGDYNEHRLIERSTCTTRFMYTRNAYMFLQIQSSFSRTPYDTVFHSSRERPRFEKSHFESAVIRIYLRMKEYF